MNNTQLPDVVITEIYQLVKDKTEIEREYWNNTPSADPDRAKTYVGGYSKGVKDGATEYAIKLHQTQQQLDKAKELVLEWFKVSTENAHMRYLLEKATFSHPKVLVAEALFNEIKTFLDGK